MNLDSHECGLCNIYELCCILQFGTKEEETEGGDDLTTVSISHL